MRLSRYRREIVPIEAKRYRRFEKGLNDSIKLHITALGITNFAQLVEAALKVERVRNSEHSRRDRQHKRESGPGQLSIPNINKKLKGSQD